MKTRFRAGTNDSVFLEHTTIKYMSTQPGVVVSAISRISPVAWQTLFLFGIDALTNVVDYGFHIYMGRVLVPGDFAIVQTINATLLIVLTTCAVLQPVVAKYVAEFRSQENGAEKIRAVFQLYFAQGTLIGLFLMGVVWLLQAPIAAALKVPPAAITVSALVVALALVRPVVFGMLQGQQQFVVFGWTRAAFAFGRLALAVLLVGMAGGGSIGGITAIFLGTALSLGIGVLWLGRGLWHRTPPLPRQLIGDGWKLSFWALIAYATYMSLLNSDLIWVNRTFAPDVAGSYAAAALFRRILSVLPGVVLVILYPRIVALVAQGRLPDKLLLQASAVVVAPTVALTLLYFAYSAPLVRLVFGNGYPSAAPLLGWMGVAMVGYGVVGIWLNLFLATRPMPFVVLLAVVAGVQSLLLSQGVPTLFEVTMIFAVGGWVLAVGGFLVYGLWLRPYLTKQSSKNVLVELPHP